MGTLYHAAYAEGLRLPAVGEAEAAAIVDDFQRNAVIFDGQPHVDPAGAGMLADVGQRFLENPEQAGGLVRRQVDVFLGAVDYAGDRQLLLEFLRLPGDRRDDAKV